MTRSQLPFAPLAADIDDDKIETLARSKGVASMVKPTAAQGEQGPIASKPVTPAPAPAVPRARMKTLSLELPDYVWTELKIRAARDEVSVRHIVMTALRRDGIAIQEIDMVEDGRRLRGPTRVQ